MTSTSEAAGSQLRAAHSASFTYLVAYIETNILFNKQVERMSMLKERYLDYLHENHPTHYNPEYSTQKLKDKIVKHFADRINFMLPQVGGKSELVYSSDIDLGAAIEAAFEANSSQTAILQRAANILNTAIKQSHTCASPLPWPPSVDDLLNSSLPDILLDFISCVISGKTFGNATEKTCRLAKSVSSDICYAGTRGQWITSKHISLGVSLHHVTGSADVVAMLNRYGHCISYTKLLEVETAAAHHVVRLDNVLPTSIVPDGSVFSQTCWDNFDVLEETLSGAGTTHSTHGIVIQELAAGQSAVKPGFRQPSSAPVGTDRSRSFHYEPDPFSAVVVSKKVEPMSIKLTSDMDTGELSSVASRCSSLLMWTVCRGLFNDRCTVPEWSGWLSRTSEEPVYTQSTVGYLAPILQPITDVSTVHQCLCKSMEIAERLGNDTAFVTFDLAAAKLAYSVVWSFPDKFHNVFIHLGGFHIMCCFMGALGTMMTGSGFEDVILDAGICASGSINQVVSGKHYNRALRTHSLMREALARLLLSAFVSESGCDISTVVELDNVAVNPSADGVAKVDFSEGCSSFLQNFSLYLDEIRRGSAGKTGQFWMQYYDLVCDLLMFQMAVKQNNVRLYLLCLQKFVTLITAADRLHYARYLPLYHMQLENRVNEKRDDLGPFGKYGISVCRSQVPACRNPVDQTIEQTINRSAKGTGGIIGFSRNRNAYYRWCMTRHWRASFLEYARDELGMQATSSDSHATTHKAQMKRSESDVQNVVCAFQNLLNPFAVSTESDSSLYCISSGKPASSDVCKDLTEYIKRGEEASSAFVKERLVEKSVSFHDPLKKLRLKTFASMAVRKTLTTSQKKTVMVKAERNLLGRLLIMSQRHDIDLQKLFKYSLSPIPWSLATGDGCYAKTNKSQLLHMLEKECPNVEAPVPDDVSYVVDGNALIQSLTKLPGTFGELAQLIFRCLPKSSHVHFVTDSYHSQSIKDHERSRRGTSSTYVIGGRQTKMPRDFSAFLSNASNKKQLIKFLLLEWQQARYASALYRRTVFFVCEELVSALTSNDGLAVSVSVVPELNSTQEEADTRIVLHCIFESKLQVGQHSTLVVRSPDTDVFILLLAFKSKIAGDLLFETGTGNKTRLISVSAVRQSIGDDVADALPGLHAFTGCDTTSCFVRKGKKKPYVIMSKSPDFVKMFVQLPCLISSQPADILFASLEKFVCSLYGYSQHSNINKVRSQLFHSRYGSRLPKALSATAGGIDLSLLPPCRDSLQLHCLRASYQSYIWYSADTAKPDLPSPVGLGWTTDNSGALTVNWISGDIMPQNLIDILADQTAPDDDYLEEQVVEEDDVLDDNMVDFVFEDDDDVSAV